MQSIIFYITIIVVHYNTYIALVLQIFQAKFRVFPRREKSRERTDWVENWLVWATNVPKFQARFRKVVKVVGQILYPFDSLSRLARVLFNKDKKTNQKDDNNNHQHHHYYISNLRSPPRSLNCTEISTQARNHRPLSAQLPFLLSSIFLPSSFFSFFLFFTLPQAKILISIFSRRNKKSHAVEKESCGF